MRHESRSQWVERNFGYDPITKPPPDTTFAFAQAAQKRATTEDLQREIIDFDSESPAGLQFMAFSTATGLSRYTEDEVHLPALECDHERIECIVRPAAGPEPVAEPEEKSLTMKE